MQPVLSAEELVSFLEAVTGLRNRVALTTAYAAGLRVGEAARLKVASIDSERMLILIENGKGGKDRYVACSQRIFTGTREMHQAQAQACRVEQADKTMWANYSSPSFGTGNRLSPLAMFHELR